MQENTKLYTNGEIHFVDQTTIPIKYALVNNQVVLVETSNDTYKFELKPMEDRNTDERSPFSFLNPTFYPSYKWNNEFQRWDPSNPRIESIKCEE